MFVVNRPRMDAVALIVIVALPLTGVIAVNEALAGFADPAVVLIAALFVIGKGLARTGVARRAGHRAAPPGRPCRLGRALRAAGPRVPCARGRFVRDLIRPSARETLNAGDVLLIDVRAPEGTHAALLARQGLDLLPLGEHSRYFTDRAQQVGMVEALIPADSRSVGQALLQARLRLAYGLTAIGLRRGRKPAGAAILDETPGVGDTLLPWGFWPDIKALQDDRADLVPLGLPAEFDDVLPAPGRAIQAVGCLGVTVALMVSGILPNVHAALIGCLLMGLLRCVDLTSAYRAISWKSLVLIVGMLPFPVALQRTGGVDLAAEAVVAAAGEAAAGEAAPRVVLAILFAVTALLGMFISNTATAVLMAPVALAVAEDLGASPYPFAMIVALAASTAFMTPVSSPVNTLVVSPGNYGFGDFVKVGVPFSLVVMVFGVLAVPWLLPLRRWAGGRSEGAAGGPAAARDRSILTRSARGGGGWPAHRRRRRPDAGALDAAHAGAHTCHATGGRGAGADALALDALDGHAGSYRVLHARVRARTYVLKLLLTEQALDGAGGLRRQGGAAGTTTGAGLAGGEGEGAEGGHAQGPENARDGHVSVSTCRPGMGCPDRPWRCGRERLGRRFRPAAWLPLTGSLRRAVQFRCASSIAAPIARVKRPRNKAPNPGRKKPSDTLRFGASHSVPPGLLGVPVWLACAGHRAVPGPDRGCRARCREARRRAGTACASYQRALMLTHQRPL
ncbi:MAG: anion permease [Acetobacteraceae bacterium]|nr:anion permease [Acetobacteraceae bacterium]